MEIRIRTTKESSQHEVMGYNKEKEIELYKAIVELDQVKAELMKLTPSDIHIQYFGGE